jgi:hypothetical protein
MEEHSLGAFENGALRKSKKRRKYWGTGENCTVRGLTICTYQVVSVDEIDVDKMGGACGTNGEK